MRNFWVKYQESSIGFENLAYLQSIENKCKGFYNVKLVSYYSKPSVKHENSTCVDFVPVQVKHIVQNRNFSLMQERIKVSHIDKIAHQWPLDFK